MNLTKVCTIYYCCILLCSYFSEFMNFSAISFSDVTRCNLGTITFVIGNNERKGGDSE